MINKVRSIDRDKAISYFDMIIEKANREIQDLITLKEGLIEAKEAFIDYASDDHRIKDEVDHLFEEDDD